MKKFLSLALALVLALGLAACLGNGRNPTQLTTTESTPTEPDYTTIAGWEPAPVDPDFDAEGLFKRLEGWWNTRYDDGTYITFQFVNFVYQDGKPCLYTGVYESEGTSFGELVGGASLGENMATLNFWSPEPEGGLWGGRPEMTETVTLDLTGLEDGTIRMKRECPIWSVDWVTYTYGGETFGEAEQKASHMRGLFMRLEGYWNDAGRWNDAGDWRMYGFVGFVYQEGRPCVIWGLYEGENTGYVEATSSRSTGEDKAELTIFFPAQPEDAMYPGPDRTETVYLDLTGLEGGGEIKVKRDTHDWETYTYGGMIIEDARANLP